VELLPHASAGAVRQALAGDTFHVLHFMGHGAFDDVTGEGALAFERSDGSPDLVSGKAFATKVCDLTSLGVVMLNACNTARASHQGGAPYRGVATALVHGGVPAVVAMQQPISDGAAIGFSTAFYRHLSRGGSLDEALTEGRQAIHSSKPDSLEWATPVLFLRVPEGDVFAPKQAEEATPRMPAGIGVGFAPVLFPPPGPAMSGRKWAFRLAAGACGAALLAFVLATQMLDPSANAAAPPVAQESPAVPPVHPPASRLEPKVEPAPSVAPAPTVPTWQPWERATVSQVSTTVEYRPIETESPASYALEPQLQTATSAVPAQPIYIHVHHPAPIAAARPDDDPWPEPAPAPDVEETVDSFEPISEPVWQPVRTRGKLLGLSGARREQQQQIKACVKQGAWIAYFKDDKGNLAPLRDTFNTQDDEDWLGVQYTEYDGPRIRLGVLRVINKSAEGEEREGSGRIEVPVAGIQDILTSALYETKRFDIIEQKRVNEVKAQQTRTEVTEPSPSSIINLGNVLGAQYLVYATVNEWNPERGSRSMGPGAFKAGKNEAEVAITFTLTDVGNGQIIFTTSERARLGEWNFAFGGGPNGESGEARQNTPVNYAIRACANKAAFKIATFLRDRKWKGSVVDIKKVDYYINAGSQQGMAPNTKLSVQSVRGIVRDPEDGTIMGDDLRGIGTLEVISVQTGFSIARVIEGCKGIKKGDRVELATDPVIPPVPAECAALDTTREL
jgi:curli biogenesis system outer membrane secretion channel CsgG